MEQRVSLVTLAVADLEAVTTFWVDGLGWEPFVSVPGEVVMFQVADRVVLSLWDVAHFEAEVGPASTGPGVPPLTLAHNVGTDGEVEEVLARARRAGAEVLPATRRAWGGYSGYFVDPAGFRWEVACAPGDISQRVLPPG